MANHSTSHREFFDLFFSNYLKNRKKSIWGEKTGSNAYCINEFLKLYPQARIIHLIRDGRDSVCSLMKRPNSSAYHSISHWLYNVSAAISCRGINQYLEVRYENLVSDPMRTLEHICNHIGVNFDKRMLSLDHDEYWKQFSQRNVHDSWHQTPLAANISKSSIGQYKKNFKENIESLFWQIHLTSFAKKSLHIPYSGNGDLMKLLGYVDEIPFQLKPLGFQQFREAIKEGMKRFIREMRFEHRFWFPLTYIKW